MKEIITVLYLFVCIYQRYYDGLWFRFVKLLEFLGITIWDKNLQRVSRTTP